MARLLHFPLFTKSAAQLGTALAFIQDLGMVHRDVKPHNIGVGADSNWYLQDLGISCTQEEAQKCERGTWAN